MRFDVEKSALCRASVLEVDIIFLTVIFEPCSEWRWVWRWPNGVLLLGQTAALIQLVIAHRRRPTKIP